MSDPFSNDAVMKKSDFVAEVVNALGLVTAGGGDLRQYYSHRLWLDWARLRPLEKRESARCELRLLWLDNLQSFRRPVRGEIQALSWTPNREENTNVELTLRENYLRPGLAGTTRAFRLCI